MKAFAFAACAGVVVVALGSTPLACGGGFTAGSSSGGDSSTPVDGPTLEGGGGEGHGETGAGEGGEGAAPGTVVYVSPTGNDSDPGLDSSHPKKTVTAGVAAAKLLPAATREVHVCAGTYSEDGIAIDFDLKLYGAYDCTSWTRTKTYGYPHPDGVDLTLIASPDTTLQEAAIVVSGPVTHAAVIDGFAITGALTTTAHTDGVRVTGAASPTLSNDVIGGGSGQVTASTMDSGSVGIRVDTQAAPVIESCVVSGGNGRGAVGSTGVVLDTTGGVSLHDSLISGGTGQTVATSGTSALGVDVRTTLTTPLTSLFIAGSDTAGTSGMTVGLRIAGSGVGATAAGCFIDGGFGLDTAAASIGVVIDAPGGGITLTGDRVYGGVRTAGAQQTIGVLGIAAGSLTVVNTLVHAGTVQSTPGAYTVGIDLDAVASPVIAFDTIYTGSGAGSAIALNTGVTGVLIRDDLLLGSDSASGSIGVGTSTCGGFIASLDHTAFGNLQTLYQCANGGGPVTSAASLAQLLVELGSVESNNVDVQATCVATDGTCATYTGCPGAAAACLPGIFGPTWSMDDGIASLFGSSSFDGGAPVQGWTLAPASPCPITMGGTKYGGLSTDAYGSVRNPTTPTMGAVEYLLSPKCRAN